MKRIYFLLFLLISIINILAGQANSGFIKGRVFNTRTNEGVPFANVQIWGTTTGAVTDFDGNFIFT